MFSTFTSFYFLCFYLLFLIIYYIIPRKIQWLFLLVGSIAYYLLAGNGLLILYPFATCLSAYLSAVLISKTQTDTKRKLWLMLTILFQIGILFVLKYVNFGINTINGIAFWFGEDQNVINNLNLIAPLGISFYTFTILGYVIDVYNKLVEPQTNLLKFLVYGMYFPNILSGPILRYRVDGEQFFSPHALNYKNIVSGFQRMLWGFFKTLVISERLAIIVNAIYGEPAQYTGIYVWIGTVCFAFQLYTNFSGCMDIVLGMSETFGLVMPENFQTPFLSKSVAEYWRKWHITLGVWMKEYVFYPLLRTRLFTGLAQGLKKRFGKKIGKQLNTFIAMFILWFSVGIWHGGDWKYVIGSGLLHWLYIVLEELMAPGFTKCLQRMHINPQGKSVDLFRILRTFFLVNIGFVFFRADSVKTAWLMLINGVRVFNVQVLFNGDILHLGLDIIEWIITIVSLGMLLAVSLLQKKKSIRERIAGKNIVVRWVLLYALMFYIILLGYYGPGYSAAEFIYQGF